ncbi:MAG: hypothetical protein ABI566_03610 [Pseudolysinimonas sp.]
MTIDVDQDARKPAPEPGAYPVTVGWTEAAVAVKSILSLKTPVHLKMNVEMHGPLLVDFGHHAFSWSTPLELFPVDAVHTGLETIPTTVDAPPYFELPGQNLDGLLWEMGVNSFGGAAAFWLSADERYHLTRWPNLTHHKHNLSQVRMIAALGNGYASATELAAFAGVDISEAQRLVNALSLMGILSRSASAPAPVAVAPTVAAQRRSLFSRLRKRLGR